MSATRLGVDLGTTWTAAAVQRAGRVEPLLLGRDAASMPSVVAIDGGTVIVGEAAEHQLLVDSASGIRESKRRLGDTAPMVMAGQPYGAEAVMGHVLRHVVDSATRNGGAVDEVVLTHPATWGEYKLDLLREAGRLAGVGSVRLLPEPSAAALHYVSLGRIAIGDIVAVYDFGGGTFDAAIVQCTDQGAVLLGPPEGLERLGGVDLDQMVLAHVNNALDGRLRELDSTDPEVRRALVQLRADCVAAKEALSNDTEATVAITVPGLNTQVRITRDEFESTVRARIVDTLGALDRAVVAAGVDQSALAGVLLVGGSSRIPVVGEEVARHTGRPVLIDADLKLVVALGAAGGSTVMATPKKSETDQSSTETADTAAAPVPKAPTTAAAQAAQKAAALRAAAGTNEKKDGKEGGFINPATVGLGVAAAGAVAAGYVGTQMLGGDDADAAEDAPADEAVPADAPLDGSLDAFDDGRRSVAAAAVAAVAAAGSAAAAADPTTTAVRTTAARAPARRTRRTIPARRRPPAATRPACRRSPTSARRAPNCSNGSRSGRRPKAPTPPRSRRSAPSSKASSSASNRSPARARTTRWRRCARTSTTRSKTSSRT